MIWAWKGENTLLNSCSQQPLVRPRVMGRIQQVRPILPPSAGALAVAFDGPGTAWQAGQAVSNGSAWRFKDSTSGQMPVWILAVLEQDPAQHGPDAKQGVSDRVTGRLPRPTR